MKYLLTLLSCFIFSPVFAADFKASFKWCSGTPEFQIANAPKGTTKLIFEMTDLWVPSYQHGGGQITYSGSKTIPCGALSGRYAAPSPPPLQVHDYQWSIKAIDNSGATLAETTTKRKFPE